MPDRSSFLKDRDALQKGVVQYLNSDTPTLVDVQLHRKAAVKNIERHNLFEAIRNLEDARDARRNIITTTQTTEDGSTALIIRDARHCKDSQSREDVEAAEITVLTHFEAAKDILKLDDIVKGDHEPELQKMAINFFYAFARQNVGKSLQDIAKNSQEEILKITDFLAKCGVKQAGKKLNQALHFQNFKQDQNFNPVTISHISDHNGAQHTIIEADVAFKGYTEEQKNLYDQITESNAISTLQQKLMRKYRERVFSGDYVIPTQLIDCVPGVRNAFEELNFVIKNNHQQATIELGDLTLVDSRKRAGALPTLLKDKKLTQEVSESNAKQANLLMCDDGATLHWNSLNTHIPIVGPIVGSKESDIVTQSRHACQRTAISFTTTPVNKYRILGVASDIDAINHYLHGLADAIPETSKVQSAIKHAITPSSLLKKTKALFKTLPTFETAISEIQKDHQDSDFVTIMKLAKNIKHDLKKASANFRVSDSFDKENASLQLSTKFSQLTTLVNHALRNKQSDFALYCDKTKTPQEDVINSCKSGKDRTGLNMFYRMANIVAKTLGISFGKVSDCLDRAGHTTTLPGSSRVGGGTPGCYQIQSPVLSALPESQKTTLKKMVGIFAENNKQPKDSFLKKAKRIFFTSKKNVKMIVQEIEQKQTDKNIITAEKDLKKTPETKPNLPNKTPEPTSSQQMNQQPKQVLQQ